MTLHTIILVFWSLGMGFCLGYVYRDKISAKAPAPLPPLPEGVNMPDLTCFMRDKGGGFVSKLAIATQHADSGNQRRLRRAFPDIFKSYSDWMLQDRKQREESVDAPNPNSATEDNHRGAQV